MALRVLCFMTLLAVTFICDVLGQKRSVVADLESLVADSTYGNQEAARRAGTSEYTGLADTLKRLQELQKFYSHQGRTRYGRSVPETEQSDFDALKALQESQAWLRQRRSVRGAF